MPSTVNAFFDNSPVFKLQPDAQLKHASAVAWFSGSTPLVSGWAWGQQYLDGGTAVAEAEVGKGKVFVLGPDVTFRGQPHATFKLLFNGIYYGSRSNDLARWRAHDCSHRTSVSHRVNHVVHANPYTESRILFRIFRRISPFPRIADI